MSETKGPFRIVPVRAPIKTDIEDLFKDLKNRSPEIRNLYAHQADILRDYYSHHIETHDVSLELPTGSGKTLVALLIAEWRRRYLGQRILYLCPTKQLANQVGQQSKDYGIEARVFVGPKKDYDSNDLMLYRAAKVTAISTYSGLFNTSPGLADPQTIILDDAHGAETYISSMWSLDIERRTEADLYSKITQMFEKDLPQSFVSMINRSTRPTTPLRTEKIPFGAFYRNLPVLIDALDSRIKSPEDSRLYFSWSAIRDGLHACHIYISYDSILIRPYIAPTLTHKPFAHAEQRLYMSASLGRSGELERITGVREIKKITTPKTYLTRGIGRRLFLFPDFAKDRSDYSRWIAHRLSQVERTLVLCPNRYEAQQFRRIVDSCSPKLSALGASNIEESMKPFTDSVHSVLLLTNRYDGIDLSGGVCTQIILDGLPSMTNLQEAFLEGRLGLDILLIERIRTRIQQASGRCTRNDTDRAAVIMLSNRLLDFCMRKENQKTFHPEMRAEICFACEQENAISNLEAMLESFKNKDQVWDAVEQHVSELRSSVEPPDTSVTDVLASAVKDEVDYAYALWTNDYEKAVRCGRNVVDALSGNKVAPYRALWCYFVAASAHLQARADKTYENVMVDYLTRAKDTCQTVSWFPHAMRSILPENTPADDASELQALTIEGIMDLLVGLGSTGPRFNDSMNKIEGLLRAKEPKDFDRGLVELGHMLGFTSWKPDDVAAPDCIWQLGNHLVFAFEGKSNETPDDGISVQDCRQASGHLKWIAGNNSLKDIKVRYSILVSPRSRIDENAKPQGKDVYYLNITDVIRLFEKAKSVLIGSRDVMTENLSNELKDKIFQELSRRNITPEQIRTLITSKLVIELPVYDK